MSRWGRTGDVLHATALASHVACCGAPLALNLLALAFGAGLVSTALPWMETFHSVLHGREGLLLAVSASLVTLGGLSQVLAWRAERRRDHGCGHDACAPRKPRRFLVFGLVCALFLINVGLFAWHHHSEDAGALQPPLAGAHTVETVSGAA